MFHRFELSRRMGEWQKPYAQRHLPGGDRSWWKSSSSSWPGGAGKICQGFIQPRYRASEVFDFVLPKTLVRLGFVMSDRCPPICKTAADCGSLGYSMY